MNSDLYVWREEGGRREEGEREGSEGSWIVCSLSIIICILLSASMLIGCDSPALVQVNLGMGAPVAVQGSFTVLPLSTSWSLRVSP